MSRLGAAVFGYDLGVIAYVIEAPDFLRTTGLDGADPTYVSNWTGFIVSVMLLGYVSSFLKPTWAILTFQCLRLRRPCRTCCRPLL